jgi:blue copper oxidase
MRVAAPARPKLRLEGKMTNNTEGYDRRAFLRTLAGGTGTIVTGGLIASCDTNPTELHNHTATSASTVDRALLASGPSPLRIPPVVSANGLVLNAAPGTADLGGGRSTAAWLFNNEFPAPTIVADSGSVASLQFVNGLPQSSIVHWHGILAPSHSDGHPHAAVAPGGTFTYPPFNIAQRAGLCWYHPHPHGLTGEQVYRGLAGAFIVRDNEEAALNLPSGEFEVPLIIRDASFDSSGNLTFTNKSSGFLGTVPLVNGTLAPILSVKAAIYRFRILNGCNTRVLNLGLTNSKRFQVIGNDGGLLRSTRELTRIEMAPGERVDVLVDLRGLAAGNLVRLRCVSALWNLVTFRSTGEPGGTAVIPLELSRIGLLGTLRRTRVFTFDGMTRINGQTYDIDRVDFQVPFGEPELWRFTTGANGPHPVHVHGAMFQVKARTGGRGRVYPWESGWKDTVLLADGETVDVRIRFTAHRGLYVMHCHQLGHEDAGMMSNFEVV